MMRPSWLFMALCRCVLLTKFFPLLLIFFFLKKRFYLLTNFYSFVTFFSTTSNCKSQKRIVSWMIFLMLWTSTKLLFLSKVLAEQQNWTSCLLSVTSRQYAYILECHRKKGIYKFFWNWWYLWTLVLWILNALSWFRICEPCLSTI